MNKHVCLLKNYIIKSLLNNKSAVDIFAILPIFKLNYTPCELWHEIYKDAQEVNNEILINKLKLLMSDLQSYKYIDINELVSPDLKSSGSFSAPKILNSSRSYKVLGKSKSILAFKSRDIAKELTRQCVDHIKNVNIQSFLKQIMAESKKNYDVGTINLIDHFERLSKLVTTEIINNPDDPCRVITKFIKICDYLHALHNYHSLFAIVSGLSSKMVYEFIQECGIPKFDMYYDLLSFNKNYSLYRNDIIKHHDGIPYIGIIMADIRHLLECKLFINEDEEVNNALINTIVSTARQISPTKYSLINEINYDIYYYFITTTLISGNDYIDVKLHLIFDKSTKSNIINRLFRANTARNSY